VLEVIRNAAPEIPVTYPDGSSTTLYAGSMSEEVRFEVLETFNGGPDHEIVVNGGAGEFREGREYIVYASLNPGTRAAHTSV
jgi:hypothetical protein